MNEKRGVVKSVFLFFGFLVSIFIMILLELNISLLTILGWILEWIVLIAVSISAAAYMIKYIEKYKESVSILVGSLVIIVSFLVIIIMVLSGSNISLQIILCWICILSFTGAGIVYIDMATETKRKTLVKYSLVATLAVILIKSFFSIKVLITLLTAALLTIFKMFVIVVIIIVAVIILLVLAILFSQAAKKENKKAIEIRKAEIENANRIKKQEEESEKIRRAEIEKKERMDKIEKTARIMAKPIKKFLIENQGKLFDEVKLRSNLVHTSSEDEIFYQALQSLPYEEGFRTHTEYLGGCSKTYYYYVSPENEES